MTRDNEEDGENSKKSKILNNENRQKNSLERIETHKNKKKIVILSNNKRRV